MKKILKYRMLIGFIVMVLGVTYLNSLSLKQMIIDEKNNSIVASKLN